MHCVSVYLFLIGFIILGDCVHVPVDYGQYNDYQQAPIQHQAPVQQQAAQHQAPIYRLVPVQQVPVYHQAPVQHQAPVYQQAPILLQSPVRHQAPIPRKRPEKKDKQDFSKIPGVPGVNYPIYHSVPHTSFSCHNVPALPGMYANVETGCQAYHVCHDGREGDQGASFLCTNGTIFNQKEFTCDWWYNVNCHEAPAYYRLNLDPTKNPYFPKKKLEEEEQANHGVADNHY